MIRRARYSAGTILTLLGLILAGGYFFFAAVQGQYGVLRETAVRAEAAALSAELASLQAEVARMENLTRRLSDDYLDLDLLDERARDVLGLIRADEVVIR
jgi:cell division protein FtsB